MEVRRTTLDLHCSYMLFGLCDHPVGGQELVMTSSNGRFYLVGRSDLKQSTQRMVTASTNLEEFMKTEELKALGLTDDQIKEVFKLNGVDVNAEKDKHKTEVEGLKAQLSTATESLKKFDGIDPSKLTETITELNQKLASQKADYEQKIADRDFNDLLTGAIASAGGRNAKAISALLDIGTLKASKNQKDDVAKAIEDLKKDNDYLFTSKEPVKNAVGGTGGSSSGFTLDEQKIAQARRVMGLKPKKEN